MVLQKALRRVHLLGTSVLLLSLPFAAWVRFIPFGREGFWRNHQWR